MRNVIPTDIGAVKNEYKSRLDRLFTDHPRCKEWFGRSVYGFIENKAPFTSPFLMDICREKALDRIESWLSWVEDQPQRDAAYNRVTRNSNLKQLWPSLLEIWVLVQLSMDEFDQIEYIREDPSCKTPDFSAQLDGRQCFLEVKEFTKPGRVDRLLRDVIDSYRNFGEILNVPMNLTISEEIENGQLYHHLDRQKFFEFCHSLMARFEKSQSHNESIDEAVPAEFFGKNHHKLPIRIIVRKAFDSYDSYSIGYPDGRRRSQIDHYRSVVLGFGCSYMKALDEATAQIYDYAENACKGNASQFTAVPVIYWANNGTPWLLSLQAETEKLALSINQGLEADIPKILAIYFNERSTPLW